MEQHVYLFTNKPNWKKPTQQWKLHFHPVIHQEISWEQEERSLCDSQKLLCGWQSCLGCVKLPCRSLVSPIKQKNEFLCVIKGQIASLKMNWVDWDRVKDQLWFSQHWGYRSLWKSIEGVTIASVRMSVCHAAPQSAFILKENSERKAFGPNASVGRSVTLVFYHCVQRDDILGIGFRWKESMSHFLHLFLHIQWEGETTEDMWLLLKDLGCTP